MTTAGTIRLTVAQAIVRYLQAIRYWSRRHE